MDALILAVCALLLAALAIALFKHTEGFTGPGYTTRAALPWAGGGLECHVAPGHGVGPQYLTPAALGQARSWDTLGWNHEQLSPSGRFDGGRDPSDPRNVVTAGNAMPEIHWGALGSGSYEAYPGRDAPDAFMHPTRYRDIPDDDSRCRCSNGACSSPVVENGGGFPYHLGGPYPDITYGGVTGPGL